MEGGCDRINVGAGATGCDGVAVMAQTSLEGEWNCLCVRKRSVVYYCTNGMRKQNGLEAKFYIRCVSAALQRLL